MQDKNYRILEAQFRKEWNGSYGPMADYALKLEGIEDWVQLTQKPDSPAPQVGNEIFGHTEVQTHGGKSYMKFKKVNPNFQGQQSSGSANRGNSGGMAQIMDLEYITTLLEAIAITVGDEALAAVRKKPDTVITEIDDKPIDLSEIPF